MGSLGRWPSQSVVFGSGHIWMRPQGAAPQVVRLSILRFEKLSADSRGPREGRALSEIIGGGLELTGAPGLLAISSSQPEQTSMSQGRQPVSAPGISVERRWRWRAGPTDRVWTEYNVRGGTLRSAA